MKSAIAAIVLCLAGAAWGQQAKAPASAHPAKTAICQQATFEARVVGGKEFSQPLGGGLVFRLDPQPDNWGWRVLISPQGSAEDWAYPVNPPLRSNNSQTMATGYGMTVREELELPHEVLFIIDREDFQRVWKLVEGALWPYNAKNPEKAAEIYFDAVAKVPTARVLVTALDYDKSGKPEEIAWMRFRAVVIAPRSFQGDPKLHWKSGGCEAQPEQK